MENISWAQVTFLGVGIARAGYEEAPALAAAAELARGNTVSLIENGSHDSKTTV